MIRLIIVVVLLPRVNVMDHSPEELLSVVNGIGGEKKRVNMILLQHNVVLVLSGEEGRGLGG